MEQDVTSAKSIQNIMGFKSGMKVAFSRLDFSTTVQETLQYIHALHILCKKWSNVLESFFTAALMYKKQSVRIPFISYCFTSLLARKLPLYVLAGPGIKQGSVHRLITSWTCKFKVCNTINKVQTACITDLTDIQQMKSRVGGNMKYFDHKVS